MESPIEADSHFENDSEDYASSYESETTSLISCVRNYTYENGRRFHGYKEGSYLMPNDSDEQERMDLSHHIQVLGLNGELKIAPVENPQRVLDLGTGTGIWAVDAADRWPSAEVIGTDLSPIQPSLVPPNLKFEVDDIEQPWTWAPNSFDYIHAGDLMGHINDWPRLVTQAYTALRPGGYLEFRDYNMLHACDDGSCKPDSYLVRWVALWGEACRKAGRLWLDDVKHEEYMRDAGFEGVDAKLLSLPVGPWPRDAKLKYIGTCVRMHEYEGAESITLAPFTRVLGWGKERVDGFLAEAKKELLDRRIHSYNKIKYVYGRKPL